MKEVLIVAVLFLAIVVLGRHAVEQRQPVILDDDIYLEEWDTFGDNYEEKG